MNIFRRLSKKTQAALVEIGDCWRLEEGKKHIRIFVNDQLAAACPKQLRKEDIRAELNIISQIRRAARGVASSRRDFIPAT